jgi:hypothetical protein
MESKSCSVAVVVLLLLLAGSADAVCDGNPHNWTRARRCDQFDARCPGATWQKPSLCDGIGGIARDDRSFNATTCRKLSTPAQLNNSGTFPVRPIWPRTFVNKGFFEEQIFVHRDPFCLAQIPAMVSNGSHCYKRQQGTFNYDSTQGSLRIDYLEASSVVLPANMTEYFYHLPDGTVHPHITRYGLLPAPICPCIALGVGPVSPTWAADAEFVGREILGIEFLWEERVVDHWVKGPHHVWSDVVTGNVVRMWQPFNGLEVFNPTMYETDTPIPAATFKLPLVCAATAKLGCINGTLPPPASELVKAFGVDQ